MEKEKADNQREYDKRVDAWRQQIEALKADNKPVPEWLKSNLDPRHSSPPSLRPGWRPGAIYNGMLSPLAPYPVKGVVWYQGESNINRAFQYRKLLGFVIQSVRDLWHVENLPFLIVQLPNFNKTQALPEKSEWAELREAQFQTARATVNSGLVVTIDIGDAEDIHPKNKQDVGKRLALWALAKLYGRNVVGYGPLYRSHKIDGRVVRVSFKQVGGGLVIGRRGPLKGFALADSDGKFVWAEANIEGKDTVAISSSQIAQPVAVRYGWADNPDCNLYNKEGLPTCPFRTDNWPGLTDDRH